MSNYMEYKDKAAFHPGYYIKEVVDESGLTQEDFAKRLGTTPKNLSVLINGGQSLSIDIAAKLSRMLGTTTTYWLKLQQVYDERQADFLSAKELEKERETFKFLDYRYFRNHFDFPDLPRKTDQQIKKVREFLSVSSLAILEQENLAVSFRSYSRNLSRSNIVNANAMVQIAINQALKEEGPAFQKDRFKDAVEFALTQTSNHESFLPKTKQAFREAGVVLVVLPNLKNSGIDGATKRVDGKILLMVNDRRHYADTFWFTLFHEIGHIMNDDFGITFQGNKNESEDSADVYAQQKLIPQEAYEEFVKRYDRFDVTNIQDFAQSIGRDAGIVYGRLQNDGKIPFTEKMISDQLRYRYNVAFQ